MREDLLHYVWKYRKYPIKGLATSSGDTIRVKTPGVHNHLSGPDFFNAQVELNGQLWAGNVEIHCKSSDWYAHGHQEDPNYDNVILHVVWEEDVQVYRKDRSAIPTLILKNYISEQLLASYHQLFDAKKYKFINCENDFKTVDDFVKGNWLNRLFIERLEQKSSVINDLLSFTNNDWEYVLFLMLLKSFGSKINGDAFLELGKSIDFGVIRKLHGQPLAIESVLMGQAGFLNRSTETDHYYKTLSKEYAFFKNKHQLLQPYKSPEFFRLRPSNFPTVRLAQLSKVYEATNNLFHLLIEKDYHDFTAVFKLGTSVYWETHYNFGKSSKKSIKKISDSFINLILINTIIPLKFCYQKYKGNVNHEALFAIMETIKKENNSIISNFEKLDVKFNDAKTTQSYLQLYNEYCVKDKCLDCAVGAHLMNIKV